MAPVPFLTLSDITLGFGGTPLLDGASLSISPGERIGLLQLAHLIAVLALLWAALGPARRAWVTGPGFLAAVPVIRKVGTQSLAVFLVSMVLARATGRGLDVVGRTTFTTAAANLTGFAILIATAYGVGWFRAQPWRRKPDAPAPRPGEPEARGAAPLGTPAE